jgi:hypothetical protein
MDQEEFRIVETQATLRIVWPGDSETRITVPPRIGQKNVPNLIRLLLHRNADVFFGCFQAVEQTKLNSARRVPKKWQNSHHYPSMLRLEDMADEKSSYWVINAPRIYPALSSS